MYNTEGGTINVRGESKKLVTYIEGSTFANCHSAEGGAINAMGAGPFIIRNSNFN